MLLVFLEFFERANAAGRDNLSSTITSWNSELDQQQEYCHSIIEEVIVNEMQVKSSSYYRLKSFANKVFQHSQEYTNSDYENGREIIVPIFPPFSDSTHTAQEQPFTLFSSASTTSDSDDDHMGVFFFFDCLHLKFTGFRD